MARKIATLFLRIRPRSGKNQHPRQYNYQGQLFEQVKGWYEVDQDMADYLATVRENRSDERSPLVFEVVSEAQALAIDKREQEKKTRQGAAGPASPNNARRVTGKGQADIETGDLSLDDLKRGTSREPKAKAPAQPVGRVTARPRRPRAADAEA